MTTRIFTRAMFGAAALFALSAAPATAETLRVEGIRPANDAALIGVNSIAAGRFGGQDGDMFAMMLEDRLREGSFDGQPLWRVLPSTYGREDVDTVMTGYAQADVTYSKEMAKREECVERDERNKCVRKEWTERECRRRTIRMTGEVRFTRYNGALLYRNEAREEQSLVICKGDDAPPSEEGVVRTLANGLSTRLTAPLIPYRQRTDIRVSEQRKGLPKPDQELFKDALRATKREAFQACVIWGEMGGRYPTNSALLFNQGLCRESAGDLAGAEEFYRTALQYNPKERYASEGLSRIASWRRGDAQVAAHFGGE